MYHLSCISVDRKLHSHEFVQAALNIWPETQKNKARTRIRRPSAAEPLVRLTASGPGLDIGDIAGLRKDSGLAVPFCPICFP